MTGFQGLCLARFQGDEFLARAYVADLGRASYFYSVRPGHAVEVMKKWSWAVPGLFVYEKNIITDIAWKSPNLRRGR
jgi:hypothetical protein